MGFLVTSDDSLNKTFCNRLKPFSMPMMREKRSIYNRLLFNNFNTPNPNLSIPCDATT